MRRAMYFGRALAFVHFVYEKNTQPSPQSQSQVPTSLQGQGQGQGQPSQISSSEPLKAIPPPPFKPSFLSPSGHTDMGVGLNFGHAFVPPLVNQEMVLMLPPTLLRHKPLTGTLHCFFFTCLAMPFFTLPNELLQRMNNYVTP